MFPILKLSTLFSSENKENLLGSTVDEWAGVDGFFVGIAAGQHPEASMIKKKLN